MADSPNSEHPTTVLRAEHQTILRVITVLHRLVTRHESGEGFEADDFARCVEFFRYFADACHHGKEEDLLFPALEAKGIPREGGPIGVMLYEHTLGRQYTREMGEALDARAKGAADGESRFIEAARQYIDLLRNHINKEDDILFNISEQVLTVDDRGSLCGKFCEVQCRAFDGRKREQLESIADELEARWPVS